MTMLLLQRQWRVNWGKLLCSSLVWTLPDTDIKTVISVYRTNPNEFVWRTKSVIALNIWDQIPIVLGSSLEHTFRNYLVLAKEKDISQIWEFMDPVWLTYVLKGTKQTPSIVDRWGLQQSQFQKPKLVSRKDEGSGWLWGHGKCKEKDFLDSVCHGFSLSIWHLAHTFSKEL